MPRWTDWLGLAGLGALALQTTAINVEATRRSYVVGAALREADDLTRLVAFQRARCRQMLRTEVVQEVAARLGLSEQELFAAPPRIEWARPAPLGTQ
ncbi:MAG: hypothetical protein HY812_17880 [Planctomycetes bacterium]|nr:hypothetical protein [Planctomycetota bacterium]